MDIEFRIDDEFYWLPRCFYKRVGTVRMYGASWLGLSLDVWA